MSPDLIQLSGPPTGVELREHGRSIIYGERTLIKYCRVDNSYAHYQRTIDPDGKEDWGKLRPPQDWFPIPARPTGVELREHYSGQVRYPQGLRTVIDYHDAKNLARMFQTTINPAGDQWYERRHVRDDEIASDFLWTGQGTNRLHCSCSACQS